VLYAIPPQQKDNEEAVDVPPAEGISISEFQFHYRLISNSWGRRIPTTIGFRFFPLLTPHSFADCQKIPQEECGMRKNLVLLFAFSWVVAGFVPVFGQSAPDSQNAAGIPKLIWIYREDIKPARSAQHQKIEQGFSQFWASNHVEPFLALDSISGNASEMMFISGYDSFAAFEKDFQVFEKAQDGPRKAEYQALAGQEADLVNGVRSVVARLRPDLSYRADSFMGGMPKSRYFQIETMRVRPGKSSAFAHGAKMFVDAYEKSSIEQPWVVYEVVSGGPSDTYLIFSEMNSLGVLDNEGEREQKITEAMGESAMKSLMDGSGEVFLSVERNLYAFNPKASLVSEAFAAMDPQFWGSHSRELAKSADVTVPKPASKKKNKQ
jgi:hypothetical protein